MVQNQIFNRFILFRYKLFYDFIGYRSCLYYKKYKLISKFVLIYKAVNQIINIYLLTIVFASFLFNSNQ